MFKSKGPEGDQHPKRIGINAHLLSTQASYRRAGIHQYIAQVLANLPVTPDIEYLIYSRQAGMLKDRAGFSVKISKWPTERRIMRIFWEQVIWPLLLVMDGIDLLHGMAFVTPIMSMKRSVITIYDLSFILYPERFPSLQRYYLQSQTARSCRNAQRIITISDSTRQDVHEIFQVPLEKIDVVMPGVDPAFRLLPTDQVERFRIEEGLPERVILHVGTLQPRKNIPVLLEAVAHLKQNDFLLVLVGGKGWHYDDIFSLIRKLGIEDKIRFTGYVKDIDLPFWYNAASVFVFPSAYEGFGMPVVEAMACGTPVIATRSSSIPEAGGDVALYFEPNNVDSLAQLLTAVLNDDQLALRMRENGLKQAKRFSWEKAGEETAQVYNKIITDQ